MHVLTIELRALDKTTSPHTPLYQDHIREARVRACNSVKFENWAEFTTSTKNSMRLLCRHKPLLLQQVIGCGTGSSYTLVLKLPCALIRTRFNSQ